MGQNSTDVAYGFGQFGSAFADANANTITPPEELAIVAIQFLANTHFASNEDTQTLDTDWGADTNAGDNDSDLIVLDGSGTEFPAGMTLYGMYDYVELHAGDVICYVAPRPDYRIRAAAI